MVRRTPRALALLVLLALLSGCECGEPCEECAAEGIEVVVQLANGGIPTRLSVTGVVDYECNIGARTVCIGERQEAGVYAVTIAAEGFAPQTVAVPVECGTDMCCPGCRGQVEVVLGVEDGGLEDAGAMDAGSTDAGAPDAGAADAGAMDAGTDAGAAADAGLDAGPDAGSDAGSDAGPDAGSDAGPNAGSDAGPDAGSDAGPEPDAGTDAG